MLGGHCRKQTCTITVLHYCSDDRQLLIALAPAVIDPIAKNRDLCLTHLYSNVRRNIAITFGVEKLEWRGYPMVKKFGRYVYSF